MQRKILFVLNMFTLLFFSANIRNSIVHHFTESRLGSLQNVSDADFVASLGKVPASIITQLMSLSSHTLTFTPGIQSYLMSLIYHVLSPCVSLHIPFPLPRCIPLANSSFSSFKVKLKVIYYPRPVLYSFAMFFHCW